MGEIINKAPNPPFMPDPVAVNAMFARIARRYDFANHLISCGLDYGWRRNLVAAVRACAPSTILDLATGSGDVAFALSHGLPPGTRIEGIDFCQPMLDQANAKKTALDQTHQDDLQFRAGDGLALPVADATFDAVTISFGLRNMADRNQSLREMYRVLRPGGHLFVLEFSQPRAWFRPFYFFYLRRILPWLAGAVTGDRRAYVYLNDTIAQFPNRQELAAEIQAVGFTQVSAIPLTLGTVALHQGTK